MTQSQGTQSPKPPQSRAEEIAESLRQSIVHGEMTPGQHLAEVSLAKEFNASRNTLREAFRLLSQQNLVMQVPNRGTSVAVPTLASILDIYRVRRLIEVSAVRTSSTSHPAFDAMNQAVVVATAAAKEGNWNRVGTANIDFHAAVVRLTDSPILQTLYDRMSAELRLAFGVVGNPEYLHSPFLGKNREIVDEIRAGRADAAAALLENYLVQSERLLLAAL
ncbi:MAG: GntR family transcriptional regulator [Gulosibacter sp.]|uniref:GntR family transcriptional regulator n=1 Tax=Gulosibacter sp. TaxID=2817531 RepID=UPI003F916F78